MSKNPRTSSELTLGIRNKMAANMAKIWHLNDHNSSYMTGRDLILLSTLWFSRSRNSMVSSDLTLDYQKTRRRRILRKFGIKILSSMTARDLMLVPCLWFSRSRNSVMSADLTLGDQKRRWRSIWRKFGSQIVISRVRCLILSKIVLSKSFLDDILSKGFITNHS